MLEHYLYWIAGSVICLIVFLSGLSHSARLFLECFIVVIRAVRRECYHWHMLGKLLKREFTTRKAARCD